MKKFTRKNAIKKALGANRVTHVGKAAGPLGTLRMGEEISRRLRSTGGRPTDPSWETKRQIPFKKETWEALSKQAESLSAEGARVSPGQLAAMMLEDAVKANHK